MAESVFEPCAIPDEHRRTGRGVRGGGQLTPQFGQIYDIYSGKRQDICLTNCVTPNGTSIHLPDIHFGWGKIGDVHRVILYDRQK